MESAPQNKIDLEKQKYENYQEQLNLYIKKIEEL